MADQGINYTVATVTVPFKADMADFEKSIKQLEDRIEALPKKFSEALDKMVDEFNSKVESMKEQLKIEDGKAGKTAEIPTQNDNTMLVDEKSSEVVRAVEKVEDQLKDVNMKVDTVNNLLLGIISGQ